MEKIICDKCKGTGNIADIIKCPKCNGDGTLNWLENIFGKKQDSSTNIYYRDIYGNLKKLTNGYINKSLVVNKKSQLELSNIKDDSLDFYNHLLYASREIS